MKCILFLCILLIVTERIFCQDSVALEKIHASVTDFANDGVPLNSYDNLPKFIRSYLDRAIQSKFSVSTKKFNATDAGGGPKRKLAYVVKLENDYLLGYEHGGFAYHFHSLVFRTNGKEVTDLYPLATLINLNNVAELKRAVDAGDYRFYRNDF